MGLALETRQPVHGTRGIDDSPIDRVLDRLLMLPSRTRKSNDEEDKYIWHMYNGKKKNRKKLDLPMDASFMTTSLTTC